MFDNIPEILALANPLKLQSLHLFGEVNEHVLEILKVFPNLKQLVAHLASIEFVTEVVKHARKLESLVFVPHEENMDDHGMIKLLKILLASVWYLVIPLETVSPEIRASVPGSVRLRTIWYR